MPHTPPVHVADALLPPTHNAPHRPQFAIVLRKSTSQPFEATPSQSEYPAAQTTLHAPEAHDAVALGRVRHTLPQAPQLLTSAVVAVSQPSVLTPLQSPNPPTQLCPHTPPTQERTAFERTGQAAPHPPQFDTSVISELSHPLVAAPSQSPRLLAHVNPQVPDVHTAVANAGVEQLTPHPPQLRGSALMFAHTPEQLESEPQSLVHVPPAHRYPAAQARPQAPQSVSDVSRPVSQPFEATPSQSPKPAAHVVTRHVPAAHPATATLGSEHAIPQPPQWELSVSVLTSQPLAANRSQSPRPLAQVKPHVADAHTAVANAGAEQPTPQAPQLVVVVAMFVSQPLRGLPSQSRKPVAQMNPQRLSAHAGAELARGGQTTPHAPQLLGSVTIDTHDAPHAL